MNSRRNPEHLAAAYAERLLASLGSSLQLQVVAEHPALAWARSGLMYLTGDPAGAPQMCPVPLTACADGALAALATLASAAALADLRGADLLVERAAALHLTRGGATAPGGSCRLLQATDGYLALNLARSDDWAMLPAWLEREASPGEGADAWAAVAAGVAGRPIAELLERGRWLGLAIAADCAPLQPPPHWHALIVRGTPRTDPPPSAPRVVDLSSLWAGPLCAHLLHKLGADVIKVESLQRPDGARQGPAALFDLLNAGKRSVALDFTTAQGRAQLHAVLAQADIVIEASRPRALRQLGIDAEMLVRERPGLSWISISGYGRGASQQDWVAFGDDAAVAAGLSNLMYDATGLHLICGDAIADPLTGLHAALAAWASHRDGGGRLIALALHDVVSHCIQFDRPADAAALQARQRDWSGQLVSAGAALQTPKLRAASAAARPLGADTAAVLAELGIAC
ncbi:MAG: CoA transferase [Nevskia sp.]|nr:CoA transferase [Nevskia sp.]